MDNEPELIEKLRDSLERRGWVYIGCVRGTAKDDNGDRAYVAEKPGTLVTVEASSNPVGLLPAVMAHRGSASDR